MQFQSDITGADVRVPDSEELSGIGPAYAAGIALGMWGDEIFNKLNRITYSPKMDKDIKENKYLGWQHAVSMILTK